LQPYASECPPVPLPRAAPRIRDDDMQKKRCLMAKNPKGSDEARIEGPLLEEAIVSIFQRVCAADVTSSLLCIGRCVAME